MTVEHYGDEDHNGTLPANFAQLHAGRALEQAARYQADLAIARWSRAGDTIMGERAAWLATVQDGLQQWLGAGGFNQYESTPPFVADCASGPLPFPGNRPLFYALFRNARSTTD